MIYGCVDLIYEYMRIPLRDYYAAHIANKTVVEKVV